MTINITHNKSAPNPFNTGNSRSAPAKTPLAATGPAARQPEADGVIVQLTKAAKATQIGQANVQNQTTDSLKAKVDKIYAEIYARGSTVTFDTSLPGEFPDLSSLTDDELAKVQLDRNDEFPRKLSLYAGGELTQRLKVSLEPFELAIGNGDRRGHAMAINQLYDQMSPDTRAALNWTPAMMVSNNDMLVGDTKEFGPLRMDSVLSSLVNSAQKGGLSFAALAKQSAATNAEADKNPISTWIKGIIDGLSGKPA